MSAVTSSPVGARGAVTRLYVGPRPLERWRPECRECEAEILVAGELPEAVWRLQDHLSATSTGWRRDDIPLHALPRVPPIEGRIAAAGAGPTLRG